MKHALKCDLELNRKYVSASWAYPNYGYTWLGFALPGTVSARMLVAQGPCPAAPKRKHSRSDTTMRGIYFNSKNFEVER